MSVQQWASSSRPVRLPGCAHIVTAAQWAEATTSAKKCPICGCRVDLAGLDDPNPLPDFTPSPAMTWKSSRCTNTEHITRDDGNDVAVSSLEGFVAAIAGHRPLIHLPSQALRAAKQGNGDQHHNITAWKAATSGCVVLGGTITMQPGAVLLLAGRGAHFSHTTFSGGVVMCAGTAFSGTFEDCTFQSCSLYVVHGASAILADCTWHDCHAALVAHGPATAATLTDCAFHHSHFCIVAEAGATVDVQESTLHSVGTAVVVNDAGSHVSMEDCTLTGARADTGVRLYDGTARLYHCFLAQFMTGAVAAGVLSSLEMHDGSNMCPHACIFDGHARGTLVDVHLCADSVPRRGVICDPTVRAAVNVRGGARLQLVRCHIRNNVKGLGLGVAEGAHAVLWLCRLHSSRCVSVGASQSRGAAVVAHCKGTAVGDIGYAVRHAGSCLRVEGGEVSAAGCASWAHEEGTVALQDVFITAGAAIVEGHAPLVGAVTVSQQARGYLTRCRMHDSVIGVHVEASRVRLKDSHIADMTLRKAAELARAGLSLKASSALICDGGQVVVEGGSVSNCVLGVFTTAANPGQGTQTTLRVEGVSFYSCSRAVQGLQECVIDVSGCGFWGHEGMCAANRDTAKQQRGAGREGNVYETAVTFQGVQRGTICDSSFRGNVRDVVVECIDGVHIRGCKFEGTKGGAGDNVSAHSSATVDDCSFADSERAFIAVGGSTQCVLQRCELTGVSTGVVAARCASVSAVDCTITATTNAACAHDGSSISLQDSTCSGEAAALAVAGPAGSLTAKRVKAHGGQWGVSVSNGRGGGSHTAGPAQVQLVDCQISSGGTGVTVTGEGVSATMLHCDVARCSRGISLTSGAVARIEKSRVAECERGVLVGEREVHLTEKCHVCGRQGRNGKMLAWMKAMVLAAVKAPGGAHRRCVHEGARSTLTLGDVEVRDCVAVGVSVSWNGVLHAEGVSVVGGTVGFEVACVDGLERSTFRDCWAAPAHGPECRAARGLRQIGPGKDHVEELGGIEGVQARENSTG